MRFKIPPKQPSSFRRPARYLAGLVKGFSPDRVEWSFGLNLHTRSPDAAAAVMEATASRNTRCQAPVYHFIITFDPADAQAGKIDPRKMREVADEVVGRMGLREYQGLVYAHKDTAHPHMHFLINRIHPETGKALSRHNDGKRLTEICREIARERGLNIPRDLSKDFGRMQDDLEIETGPAEGEYWKAKREGRKADKPFSKTQILDLRRDLRPMFLESKTWDELDQKLKGKGFYLLLKGQGLILTNGTAYLKLSDLHNRDIRLPLLNERFQERFQDWLVRQAERRIKDEDRDLPYPPPKLDGMNIEQQDRAKAIHKARLEAIRRHQEQELTRGDPVDAFDAADSEYRHWLQIRETYTWSRKQVDLESKRAAALAKDPATDERRFALEERKLFDAMAGVYQDVEKAHKEWQRVEKEKGSVLALEMTKRKAKSLGAVHGFVLISFGKEEKRQAKEAVARMVKQREKWLLAKARVEVARDLRLKQQVSLDKALRDYAHWQQTAGSMDMLEEILRRKVRIRAAAMERITPQMLERSRIAEDRLHQLRKAHREYEERKRQRNRERSLERDYLER